MNIDTTPAADNLIAALKIYETQLEYMAVHCHTKNQRANLQDAHEAFSSKVIRLLMEMKLPEADLCNRDCVHYRAGTCPYKFNERHDSCPRYQ